MSSARLENRSHPRHRVLPVRIELVDQPFFFITAVPPLPLMKGNGVVQPFETTASSSKSAGSGYVPNLPGNALPSPAVGAKRK